VTRLTAPAAQPVLYGLREVAEATGLTYQAIRQRRARGAMPAPDWELATGPIWAADTIDRWQAERERVTP
jgi:hypothetical protein